MKRLLSLCLLLVLAGCAGAPAERPAEHWSLEVEGGRVSLRDGTEPETQDLILTGEDGMETVERTLRQESDYITAKPFSDVLGSDGFILRVGPDYWGVNTYYAVESGSLIAIAETFGGEDFSVDLDGDGTKELVANVIYGGDGHASVIVYQRREDGVWQGGPVWGQLPGHDNWGINSTWEAYDPDRNVFIIRYAVKGQEEFAVLESPGMENIEFATRFEELER